jgi:hypothetical protein
VALDVSLVPFLSGSPRLPGTIRLRAAHKPSVPDAASDPLAVMADLPEELGVLALERVVPNSHAELVRVPPALAVRAESTATDNSGRSPSLSSLLLRLVCPTMPIALSVSAALRAGAVALLEHLRVLVSTSLTPTAPIPALHGPPTEL